MNLYEWHSCDTKQAIQTIDFALNKGEKLNLPELQAFQLALIISDYSFDPTKKKPDEPALAADAKSEKKDDKKLK